MNTFANLAKNRRSIRKYEDKKIDKSTIEDILKVALMSPASKRSNGWEFVVVEERKMLEDLAACRQMGSKFISDAPAAIVVCADPEKSDVWFADASIAATFIQLAIEDMGLGSCWVQVHNRMFSETVSSSDYIKEKLGIPEHMEVMNIISFGYKNEERKAYDEDKLLYDKIHWGKF